MGEVSSVQVHICQCLPMDIIGQGYIWLCGQLHRTRSVTTVFTTSGGNGVNCIPTTHGRVAMATSTH